MPKDRGTGKASIGQRFVMEAAVNVQFPRASLYLSLWKLLDRRRPGYEWLEITPSNDSELLSEIERYGSSELAWADDVARIRHDIAKTLRLAETTGANAPRDEFISYLRDVALQAADQIDQAITGARKVTIREKVTPSPALAVIVGRVPLPRSEVTKRVWDYINAKGLQDS